MPDPVITDPVTHKEECVIARPDPKTPTKCNDQKQNAMERILRSDPLTFKTVADPVIVTLLLTPTVNG